MDMQKTLSIQRMQLSDDPDDWIWVRWVWCQPGAQPLPWMHAFGSPLWEDVNRIDPPPGPQIHMLPSQFRRSKVSAYPGTHFHGSQEVWQHGLNSRKQWVAGQACGAELWSVDCGLTLGVDCDADTSTFGFIRGGQAQGGTAYAVVVLGAGGQAQGGSAEQAVGYVYAAAGGQVQGGDARQGAGYRLSGFGGQAQGGTAEQLVGYVYAAAGGQAEGGTAEQLVGYVYAAAGGQAEGGIAFQRAGYRWVSAGGEGEGGFTRQGGGVVQTATGGEAEGGSAKQGLGVRQLAVGGEAEGGSATMHGGAQLIGIGGESQGGTATQSGAAGDVSIWGATIQGTAVASLTMSVPTGVQVGDVLVGIVWLSGSTFLNGTKPATWTQIGNANYSGGNAYNLAYRVVQAGDPSSYTWTGGASQTLTGTITAVRGAAVPSAFSFNTASSVNMTTATVAATGSNGCVIVGYRGDTLSSCTSEPAGYTRQQPTILSGSHLLYTKVPVSGTVAAATAGQSQLARYGAVAITVPHS